MPIDIVDRFNVNAAVPIDSRMVVSNETERNNIVWKYLGLKVFQTDNNTSWVWTRIGETEQWLREGSGIYGGSGSILSGNTDVDFGNLPTTTGSQSNSLSWKTSSGSVKHGFIRTSNSEVNTYETSQYSIEYNSSSTSGPYIRMGFRDTLDSNIVGGIVFGSGFGEGNITESLVLRGNGQVGIRTVPTADFQIGNTFSSFVPVTVNVPSTSASIGFNFSQGGAKYLISRPGVRLNLDNNGTFSISTSQPNVFSFTDRITINNNFVNVLGAFSASNIYVRPSLNNPQIQMATSSVVYNSFSGTQNVGGEIRYESLVNNPFGSFVLNSGWNSDFNNQDPISATDSVFKRNLDIIGGLRVGSGTPRFALTRMRVESAFSGVAAFKPTVIVSADSLTLSSAATNVFSSGYTISEANYNWNGLPSSIGSSLEFRVPDSPNSSFVFRGGSYSGTRESLSIQNNAIRLAPGRVLSFSTLGSVQASGRVQLNFGGTVSVSNSLVNPPVIGMVPSLILTPEINGSPNTWGHLAYSISTASNTFTIQSSSSTDTRQINWILYYRDGSARDNSFN